MNLSANLDHGTPEITIIGQRAETLRQLRYHRTQVTDNIDEQITRHQFNALGQQTSTIDPRFFKAGGKPNVQYHSSLSAKGLCIDSVDAGARHVFYDIEGRLLWQRDARKTQQDYDYDLLGRLSTRRETLVDGTEAVRERLLYGDSLDIDDNSHKNLRGRLAQHYDTAGLLDQTPQGYSLGGAPLEQRRQLLPVEVGSHWQGTDALAWQQVLETDTYITQWQYAADGQRLTQRDAKGHQQRTAYDVAGRIKASWVTANGGTEQPVLTAIKHTAGGQRLQEKAANGVITDYAYEPETRRLIQITTAKSDGTLLQQLRYDYDPVGNVTALYNDAETQTYFRNQRVSPDKSYQYDTLYQLISAIGRQNATQQSAIDDPEAETPIDTNNCVTYTRNYIYDLGGNLTQIQHRADNNNYTRKILVSDNSNHGVLDNDSMTHTVSDIDNYFDACGNQQQLETGQTLAWNGLNQLQRLTMIARTGDPANDDRESYHYGGDGMRVRKTQITQASGDSTRRQQDVIYLPGLELRRSSTDSTITENLEVIIVGAAGRSQVRMLNWVDNTGPTDINNQQLRYSIDDLLDSSQLELDADANILTKEEYYPYGGTALRMASSASEVKYKVLRYSAKERDNSGLYYYGHRYYQPWLGRWMSVDPAGDLDSYVFVANNPINSVDEQGLTGKRKNPAQSGPVLKKHKFAHTAFIAGQPLQKGTATGPKYHKFSSMSTADFTTYATDTGLVDTGVTQTWGTVSGKLMRSRRGSVSGSYVEGGSPPNPPQVHSWRMHSLATSEALNSGSVDETSFVAVYNTSAGMLQNTTKNSNDKDMPTNLVLSDLGQVSFDTTTSAFSFDDASYAQGSSGVGLKATQADKQFLYAPSIQNATAAGKAARPEQTYHSEAAAITLHAEARSTTAVNLQSKQNMLFMLASFPNQVCKQCGDTLGASLGAGSYVSGQPGVEFGHQKAGQFTGASATTLKAVPTATLMNSTNITTNENELKKIYSYHK
ncbi:hypothetical protein AB835_02555 [Candidatus Endobugula sertula]|uniref:Insecticide toxin TcdB middle/N-terminal domain-containing protein n=1 Tax=Candidatus Endobugula sertula TaxID=62101 RepID=A0A1D2QSS7_9GAMM|nr:hypothetical protein AB835_02555 [Candidatus Endobugula sertula]